MEYARFKVNAPQVIHESIDGEVIIINLTSGTYYSLKGSGAELWELISSSPGIDSAELVDGLASRYDAPRSEIELAVVPFVEHLDSEGLIGQAEQNGRPHLVASGDSGNAATQSFEPPKLEKYTDMQDLVLLDPVHQVDETGWPEPNPGVTRESSNA